MGLLASLNVNRRTALSLGAALLAGCAQQEPYKRPQAPVPEQWLGATGEALTSPGRLASKTHWSNFFGDPQLKTLIGLALENNRDLRIAASRVQEARAQFGLARSELSPTINLNASGNIAQTSQDLTGAGAPLTSRRFDLSVSTVSFEVDFWGRLASLNEAARLSLLASEQSRRSVQLSLIADVASSYMSLLQAYELVSKETQTIELREKSHSLNYKGMQAGVASDFDFQQSRALLESSKSTLATYENAQQLARNRLNFLIGNVPIDLNLKSRLQMQGLDAALELGLSSEVLLVRPDVAAAEQRLLMTRADIAAARAAFFPKVTLTTAFGAASQGLVGLFTGGAWSFQPVISVPLFDGGRTEAALELSKARMVTAVAEYERAIQIAFREVADLLSTRQALAHRIRSADITLATQARKLEIAQGRHNLGVGSYLDVLDAQRDWISAQQSLVLLNRSHMESLVQLYVALGGGADVSVTLPSI